MATSLSAQVLARTLVQILRSREQCGNGVETRYGHFASLPNIFERCRLSIDAFAFNLRLRRFRSCQKIFAQKRPLKKVLKDWSFLKIWPYLGWIKKDLETTRRSCFIIGGPDRDLMARIVKLGMGCHTGASLKEIVPHLERFCLCDTDGCNHPQIYTTVYG